MRDPSKFRERFLAYKDGKSVREIYGLPGYEPGKLPVEEMMPYILAVENPTKQGLVNGVWRPPTDSTKWDVHAIGGGLDIREQHNPIVYNYLKTNGRLESPFLTAKEEEILREKVFKKTMLPALLNVYNKYGNKISPKGYTRLAGMKWQGHPFLMAISPDSVTGKAFIKAIESGDKDLDSVFDAYYKYPANAKRYAARILADTNYWKNHNTVATKPVQQEPIIAMPDATRVSTIPTIQQLTVPSTWMQLATELPSHTFVLNFELAKPLNIQKLVDTIEEYTPTWDKFKNAYADGKLPGYQNGLTRRLIEDVIVLNQGTIQQGYPEIPIDKARAWSNKKYTGNSGETFVKNFANNLISTVQDAVEPYREALNLRLTPQGAFRILMDAGMSKAGQAVGKLISDAAKPVVNAVSKSESVAYLTPSQMGRRIKENPQLVSNVNVDDAIKDAIWFHENLVLPAWESRGVHIGLDPKDFSIKQADFGDSKLGAIISEDGDIILNNKLPLERQALVIEHEFGGHGAELLKRKIKKLYPKQASLINKWDAKDLFLVNQAYNYSDEFLIPRPGFPKAEESVVLNREVQYLISRDNGWAVGPELLLIIKLMPRARLRRYYAEANAYGKEIIKNAKDPDLMPLRTALMNVPVFGGGLYLANTDPNEYNNGKLPGYSNGKIRIKPANRGKFNATKKRTGKTTEELTHSKNPLTRKRAIFAQNARKWDHK